VAKKLSVLFRRRTLVLLALVVLAVVFGRVGHPWNQWFGMWDGPAGG
jgi:hypothetical protein